MATNKTTRLVLTCATLALAAIAGCRGDRSASRPRQFFPDMDDSPKFKPQTQTPFFADGRAMRRPVEHTVPYGRATGAVAPDRDGLLKDDTAYYFGTEGGEGKYVAAIPRPVVENGRLVRRGIVVDRKVLGRGQERFNIYCSACHGYLGDGQGMVGKQWQGVVANFHDAKFTDPSQVHSLDGYIFHVIRNGLPADDPKQPMRMPSYGYSVNEEDAWAIVAYVRALQAQQAGSPADLAPAQRDALERTRAAEVEKVRKQRAAEAAAGKPAAPVHNGHGAAPGAQQPKGPEVKP